MQVEVLYLQGHPYALLIEAHMDWLRENGHEVIPGEISAWGDSCTRASTDLLIFQDYGASSGFRPSLSSGKKSILLGAPFFSSAADQRISASVVFGDDMGPTGDYLMTKSAVLPKKTKIETINPPSDGYILLLDVPTPEAQDWAMTQMESRDGEVKIRHHPIQITEKEHRSREPLTDAIKGASLVVCFGSTALSECVRLGAPFICSDKCLYHPMSGAVASELDRRRFVAALYGNDFGWQDIRQGKMHERIMDMVK